jgi:hypothetical protein
VKAARVAWLVGVLSSVAACADHPDSTRWVGTGDRADFPSSLAVNEATAITIDATYLYWISRDAFLYRAPRAGGEVARVPLPAAGALLGAHTDVYVGWTDGSGSAAIADIDPATGAVVAMNHQPGTLRGLVAGQRGYSFAVDAADGTLVQTCLEGVCAQPSDIPSDFKGLALDLPTKTFYVLTVDGLRSCTLSAGCPAEASVTPAETTLIAALPGTYFLLDSNGQASGAGASPNLGSASAPSPTKFVVVDGNGQSSGPIGTWSNRSELARTLLATATETTEVATACSDFDVDATSSPIYCLVGSSSIQVIP